MEYNNFGGCQTSCGGIKSFTIFDITELYKMSDLKNVDGNWKVKRAYGKFTRDMLPISEWGNKGTTIELTSTDESNVDENGWTKSFTITGEDFDRRVKRDLNKLKNK